METSSFISRKTYANKTTNLSKRRKAFSARVRFTYFRWNQYINYYAIYVRTICIMLSTTMFRWILQGGYAALLNKERNEIRTYIISYCLRLRLDGDGSALPCSEMSTFRGSTNRFMIYPERIMEHKEPLLLPVKVFHVPKTLRKFRIRVLAKGQSLMLSFFLQNIFLSCGMFPFLFWSRFIILNDIRQSPEF